MVNFLIWTRKNQPRVRSYRRPTDKPKEVIVRREFTKAPQELQAEGPSQSPAQPTTTTKKGTETRKLKETTTNQAAIDAIKDNPPKAVVKRKSAPPVEHAIFKNVEESLTTLQIQQIVFQNLELLGQKAVELGAGQEWNDLMIAMGLEGEVIAFIPAEGVLEEAAN
jgi:hypothetical protein